MTPEEIQKVLARLDKKGWEKDHLFYLTPRQKELVKLIFKESRRVFQASISSPYSSSQHEYTEDYLPQAYQGRVRLEHTFFPGFSYKQVRQCIRQIEIRLPAGKKLWNRGPYQNYLTPYWTAIREREEEENKLHKASLAWRESIKKRGNRNLHFETWGYNATNFRLDVTVRKATKEEIEVYLDMTLQFFNSGEDSDRSE